MLSMFHSESFLVHLLNKCLGSLTDPGGWGAARGPREKFLFFFISTFSWMFWMNSIFSEFMFCHSNRMYKFYYINRNGCMPENFMENWVYCTDLISRQSKYFCFSIAIVIFYCPAHNAEKLPNTFQSQWVCFCILLTIWVICRKNIFGVFFFRKYLFRWLKFFNI